MGNSYAPLISLSQNQIPSISTMRHLTADLIYPIATPPLPKGIITIDDEGTILAVSPAGTYASEDLAYYRGILCPGFVNAHCHLELSHLQDQIPPYTGLANFLRPISALRMQFSTATIDQAMVAAEAQMLRNGIVAVGDISNDATSFEQKRQGNLRYHTFIEIVVPFGDTLEERISQKMQLGIDLLAQAPRNNGNTTSLAPHAPYTMPPAILQAIDEINAPNAWVSSIHHQECNAENEMFQTATGDFVDLYHSLGIRIEQFFSPISANSSQYILRQWQNPAQLPRLLLVHNTISTDADIRALQQTQRPITWVFCPNANRYIENRLPHFDTFRRLGVHIAIGTDSLTSNWQLCILSELKTIADYAPHIPIAELLQWATLNGAQALGYERDLGSFEVGKKPGIVHIGGINPDSPQITAHSTVRRIV
jgi:cytosine/adenosine deaminase-related metal-dependent hydrolase